MSDNIMTLIRIRLILTSEHLFDEVYSDFGDGGTTCFYWQTGHNYQQNRGSIKTWELWKYSIHVNWYASIKGYVHGINTFVFVCERCREIADFVTDNGLLQECQNSNGYYRGLTPVRRYELQQSIPKNRYQWYNKGHVFTLKWYTFVLICMW